jgi:hypothetical protein
VTSIVIREIELSREDIIAKRRNVVGRLGNLGLVDTTGGTVAEPVDDDLIGYEITVNGQALPVAISGYEVVATAGGPAVTVTIPARTLVVGEPPVAGARPAHAEPEQKAQLRVWGDPDLPDPRANMPGWPVAGPSARAELGEQIARNTECSA